MSQWGVQIVIGRLLTDDTFRVSFSAHGRECLAGLRDRGIDLDDEEAEALITVGARNWSRMAARIDRRLKRQLPHVESPAPDRRRHRPLTAREQRVLRGVFEGLTNKQIAAGLGVSEPAVKNTLQHLFRKTHVRTRSQLVRAAIEGAVNLPHGRR